MPLPKRLIEPTYVARSGYSREDLSDSTELETVTNTTLTNIIRQLSSLSKHSEDLFGELAREAGNLNEHANSLQARIDRLAIKVTQLDSTIEEVSLQDIQLKKAFKSATVFDQQIFSRATMPAPMLETYNTCDKPPPLDKLNCYRDDGKDGLKYYTDPNYFFELWRQEMLKEMVQDRSKKPHRPRQEGAAGRSGPGNKKRPRQPQNTVKMQVERSIQNGDYQPSNNYGTHRASRPDSIGLQLSYPTEAVDGIIYGPGGQHYQQPVYPPTGYDDNIYNSQNTLYGHPANGGHPEGIYSPGTPSRSKAQPRPSQPPPAPPSSGSGSATPIASNANTPTRSRSMSTGRDTLPPPPPVPEGQMMSSPPSSSSSHHMQSQHPMMNGNAAAGGQGAAVAAIMLARTHSTSRSGSPLMSHVGGQGLPMHHQHQQLQQLDQNAQVMAQLNSQINSLNNINMQMTHMNSLNDLPPPPPIPEHMSPRQSPPHAIAPPPPPPPPPPLLDGGGHAFNGGMQPHQITPTKKVQPKKVLPPIDDTRNDLMNAIRSGIKLRKVEKKEQKENSSGGLTDVASILARRVAIELSGTDTDSDSDDDSEGWADHNETSA